MKPSSRLPLRKRYRSDLRAVVGSSATAYGYTLTVWSAGMVLSHAYGPPSPPLIFAFFGGAVLAFAVVGALAFRGRDGSPWRRIEPRRVVGQLPPPLGGFGGRSRLASLRLRAELPGVAPGRVRGDNPVPRGRGGREYRRGPESRLRPVKPIERPQKRGGHRQLAAR